MSVKLETVSTNKTFEGTLTKYKFKVRYIVFVHDDLISQYQPICASGPTLRASLYSLRHSVVSMRSSICSFRPSRASTRFLCCSISLA